MRLGVRNLAAVPGFLLLLAGLSMARIATAISLSLPPVGCLEVR